MKKFGHGFTLIEVAIFLAITGLLFLTITVGVQNSIFQQRYNDSVQNFVEFLRTIYAETMNVQSANSGNSNQAIYGKLVVFGESEDLGGNAINNGSGKNEIFAYDVIGNAEVDMGTGNIKELLGRIGATVVINSGDENATIMPAGIVDTYTPKWAAEIQPICKNAHDCSGSYIPYKGALLVVRHPRSGTVYTFVGDKALEVNKAVREANQKSHIGASEINAALASANVLGASGVLDSFSSDKDIDFCVNPNGHVESDLRADVRIRKGARNSSAIEILAGYRSEDNKCVKE